MKFDKTSDGSNVKVFTPEAVKKEMELIKDLRKGAGLPYWSQERIYQELYSRYFHELLEDLKESIQIIS